MGAAGWHPLRDGKTGGVLLCVDFGQGRPDAGFPDLAALLPSGDAVWESDFTATAPGTAAAEQVRHWLDLVAEQALHVRGVLGYCAGGSLACALGDQLVERGHGCRGVLLLDPEVVSPRTVYWQFVWTIEPLADQLPATALAEARRFAERVSGDPALGLPEMAAELSVRYAELVAIVCAELDLDDDVAADFRGRFEDYLAYLLTASGAEFGCRHCRPTVLTSADYDPAPVPGGRPVPLSVSHERLLASAESATVIADVLGIG